MADIPMRPGTRCVHIALDGRIFARGRVVSYRPASYDIAFEDGETRRVLADFCLPEKPQDGESEHEE